MLKVPVFAGNVSRTKGSGEQGHLHAYRMDVHIDRAGVYAGKDRFIRIGLIDSLGSEGIAHDVEVGIVNRVQIPEPATIWRERFLVCVVSLYRFRDQAGG